MGEACGIVLIYALYFKEPVMNISRILEKFFGSMSLNILCALQLFLFTFFFCKIYQIYSLLFRY